MSSVCKLSALTILLSIQLFAKDNINDFYELLLQIHSPHEQIDSSFNDIFNILTKEFQISDSSLIIICSETKPKLKLPEKRNVYFTRINDLKYLTHFSNNSNDVIMFELLASAIDTLNFNLLVNNYKKSGKNKNYVFWEKTSTYFELNENSVKKFMKTNKFNRKKVKILPLNEQ